MTLITILNRELHELTPIIYEFKDKTKRHILIYDDKDKFTANRLKKWIKNFSLEIEMMELDEDSKSDMLSIQKDIISLNSEDIYLNATGSDTALLVILSGVVIKCGGKIIAYDKFENSYNLIDSIGFSNHTITNNMNIDKFISSLGYHITSEVNQDNIFKRKEYINTLFGDFNILFRVRRYLQQNRLEDIASKYPIIINILIKLNMIDSNYKAIKDVSYFGILFEEFIYLNLIKYNFDDIKIGVIVLFNSVEDEFVNNEFDILAIKDNHIYTIECKLGDNISAQDIIYKSDSLLGYFGDDSKNIIVNIHPNNSNKIRKPKVVFGEKAKLRAITNSINIYNGYVFGSKKFDKKVSNFFEIKKRMFLLGGYDLEMKTIKKLLDRYNQSYIDNNLSWGAKLSSYINNIKNNYLYIGIELIEDIAPPLNYITIDHHNEQQSKLSSLEQVANILGINLSRKDKLIALNDSGYIPAMVNFGATQKEIDEIRKKDRKAQGVTTKDEELAIKSINLAQKYDDIVLLEALTSKFSAIVDRLYGKNILIYRGDELIYYGRDIKLLVDYYSDNIKEKKVYYGGGFGFFGFGSGNFTNEEIKNNIHIILNILKSKKK